MVSKQCKKWTFFLSKLWVNQISSFFFIDKDYFDLLLMNIFNRRTGYRSNFKQLPYLQDLLTLIKDKDKELERSKINE